MKSQYVATGVDDLCKLRGYVGEDQRNLLSEMHIGLADFDESYSRGTIQILGSMLHYLLHFF